MLPTATIGGWAAYVALSHQRVYGYDHPFAWLLALFWLLSALSAMRCFILQRRVVQLSVQTRNRAPTPLA